MLSRCWSGDWRITQGFSSTHNGLDLATPNGTNLYAPELGVIHANTTVPSRNGEKYTCFRSIDGVRKILYVHIGSFEASGSVKAGQLIAKSDNTGLSTGPHTHIIYRENDVAKDPMAYLGGGAEMNTPETNEILYKYILGRPQGTAGDPGAATNLNKPLDEVLLFMYKGQEATNFRAWVDSMRTEFPKLQSTIEQLKTSLSNQAAEIESLEKELDHSNKVINEQVVKVAELEAKVVELSNLPPTVCPEPTQSLGEPTFSSVLESIRLLIKKWLGVS